MIARAAAAAAVLVWGAAVLVTEAPSVAAAPDHVAVVVDYNNAGAVSTACVAWHSGMTGADVLSAAYTVTYARDGFVLKINGVGVNSESNTQYYWAYFHDGAYSVTGAEGSHPAAGTVEGWAFDRQAGRPAGPPAISYATICAGRDPVAYPTRAPTRPASALANASASAVPTGADPATSAAPIDSPTAPAGTAAVAVATVPSGASAKPTSTQSTASVVAQPQGKTHHGARTPWALILGLLALAAIAAGVVLSTRRQPGAP
jgi:hypothetical protein